MEPVAWSAGEPCQGAALAPATPPVFPASLMPIAATMELA